MATKNMVNRSENGARADTYPASHLYASCIPSCCRNTPHANPLQAFVAATGFSLPLFVDGVDNQFQDTFAAHPERFFIVSAQGRLLMKGQPLEGGYNLNEVRFVYGQGSSAPSPSFHMGCF